MNKFNLSFEEVSIECLNNKELVNEFCRLKGIKHPLKLSPIEQEIDKACGFDAKQNFVEEFANFVFEFVYLPLVINDCKDK